MPDWIKCSDRLPEDEGFYLIYCKDEDYNVTVAPFYKDTNCFGYGTDFFNLGYETHWMPLPQPPGEEISSPPEGE